MPGNRYTQAQVIRALKQAQGFVTVAAEALGCSIQTIYNFRDRYPKVKEVLLEQREKIKDMAEISMVQAIQNQQGWAVTLCLTTLGRDRGYGREELIQVPAPGSQPIYGVMVVPGMLPSDVWQQQAQQHYEQRRLADEHTTEDTNGYT